MTIKRLLAAMAVILTGMSGLSGSARAESSDPVGAFDSISVRFPSVFVDPSVPWELHGWAADPDAPGQVIGVALYVDGQESSTAQVSSSSEVPTGLPRPDVAAVVPYAGENSGWAAEVLVSDGQPHTVCAYAINAGAGSQNTTLGCQQIPALGTPNLGDPQGFLDAASTSPGVVRLQGWAGDPDPDAVTTPVRVFQDGRPLVHVEPSLDRPDVHAALPGLVNAAGFDAVVPALPGLHIYCVDAGNTGEYGTANTSLGCVLRDVPGPSAPGSDDLHGAFDALVPHFDPESDNPGGTFAEGWAWDPTGDPPYRVTIRGVERDAFGVMFSQDGMTSEPRPDVRQAFPDAPVDTGFKVDFPRVVANPPVYYCAYAERTGAEQFLGCLSVQTL